jgi:hypothetical protein
MVRHASWSGRWSSPSGRCRRALTPAREQARPLRNLVNLSAGELARWIKITTPNDRPHVIRVLETTAAILQAEVKGANRSAPS